MCHEQQTCPGLRWLTWEGFKEFPCQRYVMNCWNQGRNLTEKTIIHRDRVAVTETAQAYSCSHFACSFMYSFFIDPTSTWQTILFWISFSGTKLFYWEEPIKEHQVNSFHFHNGFVPHLYFVIWVEIWRLWRHMIPTIFKPVIDPLVPCGERTLSIVRAHSSLSSQSTQYSVFPFSTLRALTVI